VQQDGGFESRRNISSPEASSAVLLLSSTAEKAGGRWFFCVLWFSGPLLVSLTTPHFDSILSKGTGRSVERADQASSKR